MQEERNNLQVTTSPGQQFAGNTAHTLAGLHHNNTRTAVLVDASHGKHNTLDIHACGNKVCVIK